MIAGIALISPLIIGIILIVFGFAVKKRPKGKISGGIYADAVIVDTAEKLAYCKRTPYRAKSPVVEFDTENGRVTAVYPYFIHEDYYFHKIGDILKICYDKKNTNRFHIENDGSHDNIGTFLIGGGVFMNVALLIIIIQYGGLF